MCQMCTIILLIVHLSEHVDAIARQGLTVSVKPQTLSIKTMSTANITAQLTVSLYCLGLYLLVGLKQSAIIGLPGLAQARFPLLPDVAFNV